MVARVGRGRGGDGARRRRLASCGGGPRCGQNSGGGGLADSGSDTGARRTSVCLLLLRLCKELNARVQSEEVLAATTPSPDVCARLSACVAWLTSPDGSAAGQTSRRQLMLREEASRLEGCGWGLPSPATLSARIGAGGEGGTGGAGDAGGAGVAVDVSRSEGEEDAEMSAQDSDGIGGSVLPELPDAGRNITGRPCWPN